MPLVVDDDERVTQWVAQHSAGGPTPPAYLAVGYEREGELIAGVYFDNCTDTNVFAHIASTAHTLPVEFLAYVAFMAYETLGCKRMTFVVADNNIPCLKLVVGLGAVLEATIKHGHKHGDTYLFALWDTNEFYRRLKRARPAVAEGATSGK
jgi:hypothetical protein